MGLSKPAAERRRGKAGVVDRVKGDEDSRLDGCIRSSPGGKFQKVRPRQRDTLHGVPVITNYALDFYLQVDTQAFDGFIGQFTNSQTFFLLVGLQSAIGLPAEHAVHGSRIMAGLL